MIGKAMMETKNAVTRTQYFGMFLQRSLKHVEVSRQDFARNLGLELSTVDSLLEGTIPAGHISDELLVAIALQINLDPHVLRLALGWVKLGSLDEDEIETAPADSRETQEAVRQAVSHNGCGGKLRLDNVMVTLESFVAGANDAASQRRGYYLQAVLKTLHSFMEWHV